MNPPGFLLLSGSLVFITIIFASVCLFIYLSINLSINLSIFRSICLSVYFFLHRVYIYIYVDIVARVYTPSGNQTWQCKMRHLPTCFPLKTSFCSGMSTCYAWLLAGMYIYICIWRFPRIGAPPAIIYFNGISPCKPTSYWGTPISGNHHIYIYTCLYTLPPPNHPFLFLNPSIPKHPAGHPHWFFHRLVRAVRDVADQRGEGDAGCLGVKHQEWKVFSILG